MGIAPRMKAHQHITKIPIAMSGFPGTAISSVTS